MGWFFEDHKELIPTGKVIAEERKAGQGLSELGKFVGILLLGWLLATAGDSQAPPVEPRPTSTPSSLSTP